MRRYRRALERGRTPHRSTLSAALMVVPNSVYWRSKFALRALKERPIYLRARALLYLRPRALFLRTRLRLAPEAASLYVRLGDTLNDLGRTDEAFAARERAVALGCDVLDVYHKSVYYLHTRGRWDDMREMMNRTVELQEALAERRGLDPRSLKIIDRDFLLNIGCLALLDIIAKHEILAGGLRPTVVLARPSIISNRCYLDYWRKYFPVVIDNEEAILALEPLAERLRLVPHTWRSPAGRLVFYSDAAAEVEQQWDADGRDPLLRLSESHREAGWDCLESLGVPRETWFVALHVREESAWDPLRNADISTYRRAMAAIVDRGGWVIRMGAPTTTPLPELPQVVDYAHSEARSDWMDVFLWAQARFLVGTESGPAAVAGTFGVPAVGTNWILAHRDWFSRDIYLPKLHWSERESRYLTFREALSTPAGFVQRPDELAPRGVRLVDNSPEEIEDAVLEMLERLEGEAVYTAEDEELQRRFYASEPPLEYPLTPGVARVAREFLRRYAHLCD